MHKRGRYAIRGGEEGVRYKKTRGIKGRPSKVIRLLLTYKYLTKKHKYFYFQNYA